uniref:Putative secreted protein n=1 Tax=Anopheles triannulatus TaxID=58253 RepID=A0A2M4B564_9DIPT
MNVGLVLARSLARSLALLFRQLKRPAISVCVCVCDLHWGGMWCTRCAAASSISRALVYLLTGSQKGEAKAAARDELRLVLTQQQQQHGIRALACEPPRAAPHDHALVGPPPPHRPGQREVSGDLMLRQRLQLGHGQTSE